jgi:hypothetical protein
VAGEPRSVEADYEPGIAEADLGDQFLEAVTLHTASARFAEILVNDLHALVGPPESDGAIDQPILQLRALLVLPHLVQGRLPHIDIRQFGAMRRRHPLISDVRGDQHGPSPLPAPHPSAASAATAPPIFGLSAFESLATGSATDTEGPPEPG